MSAHSFATAATAVAWNGPTCSTCGARYLDSHACSREDIMRRINELLGLLGSMPVSLPFERSTDRTASCPCRPENGGSGVCGCILSAGQVRC